MYSYEIFSRINGGRSSKRWTIERPDCDLIRGQHANETIKEKIT